MTVAAKIVVAPEFSSFREFYPFYLTQHENVVCRRLHVVGTVLSVGTLVTATTTGAWWLLPLVPVFGYGPSWVGHFFFEHNRPATFRNPLYSFLGDLVMTKDVLTGKIPW
ncbi:MAG: DUF962 domain-containing protein [Pseudomonadota bacterium]